MTAICVISPQSVDLLNARIVIAGHEMEVCGLARQEYKDGLLRQWWIVMEAGKQKKQA